MPALLFIQQSPSAGSSGIDWSSVLPAAIVAAVISGLINIFWEKRKLSRPEKAAAYSNFLQASSKRWKAFGDRDGAAKRGDSQDAIVEIEKKLAGLRDEQWGAYALVQVVGSPQAMRAALAMINAFDDRNRNFRTPGSARNVGAAERTSMQNAFVAAARKDMNLRGLNKDKLKSGFESAPRS